MAKTPNDQPPSKPLTPLEQMISQAIKSANEIPLPEEPQRRSWTKSEKPKTNIRENDLKIGALRNRESNDDKLEEEHKQQLQQPKPGLFTRFFNWVKNKIFPESKTETRTSDINEKPITPHPKHQECQGMEQNQAQSTDLSSEKIKQKGKPKYPHHQPETQARETLTQEQLTPVNQYQNYLKNHLNDPAVNKNNYNDLIEHTNLVKQQIADLQLANRGQISPELDTRLRNNGETIFNNQMKAYAAGIENELRHIEQLKNNLPTGHSDLKKLEDHSKALEDQMKRAGEMQNMPSSPEKQALHQAGAKADRKLQESRASIMQLQAPQTSIESVSARSRNNSFEQSLQPERTATKEDITPQEEPPSKSDPSLTTSQISDTSQTSPEKATRNPPSRKFAARKTPISPDIASKMQKLQETFTPKAIPSPDFTPRKPQQSHKEGRGGP